MIMIRSFVSSASSRSSSMMMFRRPVKYLPTTVGSSGSGRASVLVRSFANLMDRAKMLRKQAAEREVYTYNNNNNQALEISSDEQAMSIFDEIDLNHDGVISREEFLIAVEKMRHLDLTKMKRALECNDISFNHKASVLGRTVVIANQFDAWKFMGSLPDYKYVSHLRPPVALPPKPIDAPEYTLVLDMDETLLHCSPDDTNNNNPYHHEFDVHFQGKKYHLYSWLRPGLQDFLDKIHDKFEVIIFTASQSAYANAILDIIDPGKIRKKEKKKANMW